MNKPVKGAPRAADEGHPLFTPDDGSAPPVGKIYVSRGGISCPRTFVGEELQSREQLYSMFGGGTYQVRARDPENKRWVGSFTVTFPGPPKPFIEEAAPAPPPVAVERGGIGEMIAGFSALMAPMMTMMVESQRSNTQLLAAVLGARTNTASEMAPFLEFASKAMLQAKHDNPHDPAKQFESFMGAFESGIEFAKGAREGAPPQSEQSDVAAVVDGVKTFFAMDRERRTRLAAPAPPPRAPAPVRASPVAAPSDADPAALAAARELFGEAAEGATDEDVIRRYRAHLARGG